MGLLGCIADDLTGASDLANELAGRGMRVVQTVGVPTGEVAEADAIVISLKSRSTPAAEAVSLSLAALEWLRVAGCTHIFFKYCSTFDSTREGNIGPVLEALRAATGAGAVIACPAFPATGRTVYQGHLFVGQRLLDESGMEHHPLNPMTDSNLVRVLQAQMRGQVGHLPLADLRAGLAASRMSAFGPDIGAVIADAIDVADLDRLGAYCATQSLSSGASGLGAGIARAMVGRDAGRASMPMPAVRGGRAVIAGSCSRATRRQVKAMADRFPALRILFGGGRSSEEILGDACAWIDAQDPATPILIYSSAAPDEVVAREAGEEAGALIESLLSDIAAHLVARGVEALIVAGGETSGAVVQRLGVSSLAIGPEIDPGVPWTIGRRDAAPPILLALKSGNFGSDDFMIKAWDQLP